MIVAIAVSHNSRGYRPAGVVAVAVLEVAVVVDVLLNIVLKDMSRAHRVNRLNPRLTFLTAAARLSI